MFYPQMHAWTDLIGIEMIAIEFPEIKCWIAQLLSMWTTYILLHCPWRWRSPLHSSGLTSTGWWTSGTAGSELHYEVHSKDRLKGGGKQGDDGPPSCTCTELRNGGSPY